MSPLARLGMHALALGVALAGTALVLGAMVLMNDDAPARAAERPVVEHVIEPVRAPPPRPKDTRPPPRPERREAPRSDTRPAAPSLSTTLVGVDLGLPALGPAAVDPSRAAALAGAAKDAQALVMSESAVDAPPRVVDRVAPDYPARARAEGIEGVVTVSLLVGADGRVERAKVVAAEPAGVFDEVALAAVRAWRFEPATYGGQPVRVWARQSVRFGLL